MRPLHTRRRRSTRSDAQQALQKGMYGGMNAEDYISDVERCKIVQEVSDQLFETAQKHFPRTSNLEYALLKTHLIVEFAITQFIRCSSQVLVAPESIRFTFNQKLEIAILHGFGSGCSTTVPSIELLNRIRNQVAHHFEIDINLINELIQINSEDLEVAALTDRQRISFLKRFCYGVCGQVVGTLRALIEFTKRD